MKKIKTLFWIEAILHLLGCIISIWSTIDCGSTMFTFNVPDPIYWIAPILFGFFTVLFIGAAIFRIIMVVIFFKISQKRLQNKRKISILHLIIINIIAIITLPILSISEMPCFSFYAITTFIMYVCEVIVCCVVKKKNTESTEDDNCTEH